MWIYFPARRGSVPPAGRRLHAETRLVGGPVQTGRDAASDDAALLAIERRAMRRGPRAPSSAAGTASASRDFFRWKSKYGGLEVNEARLLRALDHENSRLKRIVADLTR